MRKMRGKQRKKEREREERDMKKIEPDNKTERNITSSNETQFILCYLSMTSIAFVE